MSPRQKHVDDNSKTEEVCGWRSISAVENLRCNKPHSTTNIGLHSSRRGKLSGETKVNKFDDILIPLEEMPSEKELSDYRNVREYTELANTEHVNKKVNKCSSIAASNKNLFIWGGEDSFHARTTICPFQTCPFLLLIFVPSRFDQLLRTDSVHILQNPESEDIFPCLISTLKHDVLWFNIKMNHPLVMNIIEGLNYLQNIYVDFLLGQIESPLCDLGQNFNELSYFAELLTTSSKELSLC